MILTLDEYDELYQQIRTTKNEGKRVKEEAERAAAKSAAKSAANAEEAVKQIQSEAARKIEQLQKQLDIEQSGKLYQMGLNRRLLEISRERANADRNIKPKRGRSGYIVLSSRQKLYRYKLDRNHSEEVFLWETVIQTPYSVEFSAEQAMTESTELFALDENGQWLIGRLGVNCAYNGKYEDLIDDPQFTNWRDYNVVVGQKIYNANGKAGYWEVILTHTLPLVNISAEL